MTGEHSNGEQHNGHDVGGIAGDQLRAFVDRYEHAIAQTRG
jgi:hypothetical protein